MRKLKGSSGLLIFKGKLLLLLRDNNPNIFSPNCWHLIGGLSDKNEEPQRTFIREVKEETNIDTDIKKCNFLSIVKIELREKSYFDKYLYHYELTSEEVKQIKLGKEGQKLKFFGLKELEKISLSKVTIHCLEQNKDIIKKILK